MYLSKLHNYINSHCHYNITMPLMHFIVLSWNLLCHQNNFYSHAHSTFRHLKMGDVDRPKGLLYIQFVIVLYIAKCLLITFLHACIFFIYICIYVCMVYMHAHTCYPKLKKAQNVTTFKCLVGFMQSLSYLLSCGLSWPILIFFILPTWWAVKINKSSWEKNETTFPLRHSCIIIVRKLFPFDRY